MLDIPAAIMALFQTDGTRKNVRIHFPGGEMADLTNENIVRESLRFTESLCSRDVFRFGLAEASVLEIETVGVGNMYGMTIEAGIEIDTSSLAAAVIAGIVADPGDGVIVEEQDSDIGYGFYRVPLGVFRVESCPRNHGAMTHRKVTAYGAGGSNSVALSPFEAFKQSVIWNYTVGPEIEYDSLDVLVDANIGYYNPAMLASKYTKTQKSTSLHHISDTYTTLTYPAGKVRVQFTALDQVQWTDGDYNPTPLLYAVELVDFSNESLLSFMKTTLEGWGIGEAFPDIISVKTSYFYPVAACGNNWKWYVQSSGIDENFIITEDAPILYYPSKPKKGATFYAPVNGTLSLSFQPTGASTWETITQAFDFSPSGVPINVYRLAPVTPNNVAVSFQATGTLKNIAGNTFYSFANTYEASKLIPGYAEISGEFWKDNRAGGLEKVALDPASAISVAPGDYEEMWWDEYTVSPIGSVIIAYRDSNATEMTVEIPLSDGASQYDMSDNETLKILSGADLSTVEGIIRGSFAANAANVDFVPVELSIQGWPWMEAGDALEITAEDGTVVDTYALRIEMSGIQHMTMDITSQGGEIMGEV